MNDAQRQLLGYLADGAIHSGTVLAAHMGMSRTGIAQHMGRLRSAGWPIEAVPGRGYRLHSHCRPLDRASLERAMYAWRHRVAALECLDAVDSTSTYLDNAALTADGRVHVCIADAQSRGRGRRGRHWVAVPGRAITFSLGRRIERPRGELGGVGIAAGVGLAEAMHEVGIPEVAVKWPNDLVRWCNLSKLGGILVEVRREAAGHGRLILGVGINHGPHPASEDQAVTDVTALMQGEPPERSELAGRLVGACIDALDEVMTRGLDAILARYRAFDALAGRRVRVTLDRASIDGVSHGLGSDGSLCIEDDRGHIHHLHSGDVSVRPRS